MVTFLENTVGRTNYIWAKFPSDPGLSEDPDENGIIGAMTRLCSWGGADRKWEASNGQVVLSWEFPRPSDKSIDPDGGWRWSEALEALKHYKAQPVTDRSERIRFLDGFS